MAIFSWSRLKCFLRCIVHSYQSRTFVIITFLLCLYSLTLPFHLQSSERLHWDSNALGKIRLFAKMYSNGNEIDNNTMHYLKKLNVRIKDLQDEMENIENGGKNLNKNIGQLDSSEPSINKSSACGVTSFEGYSSCSSRLQFLKESWQSDVCYAEWGINGTECSMLEYLSTVEQWCPVSPKKSNQIQISSASIPEKLIVRENFSALYEMIGEAIDFKWILTRIKRMKKTWLDSARQIARKSDFQKFEKKKILIYPGLLSMDWGVGEKAHTGGPLGELVQWADLIAALYILGHEVTVTNSKHDLKRKFEDYFYTVNNISCPLRKHLFDLIYIDITGLEMLKKVSNSYFTHTPDNTFLGFVTDVISNDSSNPAEKQHMALVYGKQGEFWKGNEKYLKTIQELIPLHATTHTDESVKFVPTYVVHHGVLAEEKFHSLLRSAKIFVGMGFPYEGPAPLEAIASGAVFLNVKFNKNSSYANNVENFYMDKPTSRRPTSQHPYAGHFIGSSLVKSVDTENLEEVESIVKDILESPLTNKYLPYEFTAIGMLERLALLVEKQNFCFKKNLWPPLSSLEVIVSDELLTCAEACSNAELICEPGFFPYINQRSTFKRLGITCETFVQPSGDFEELDYPSYQDKRCYIQGEHKLFSCTGRYTKARRICPCRDYKKGQIALCKSCGLSNK